ncbi:lipoprotein-anchoring transpeptidase ErfK/SrfK [Herbihabitans rhizosphaerae]|uniref:Lipoprotein-anchoring transpeptidase ErfK/SrfK n=1 Tax=Herbihabitans rhizosphaerae TaxID=1872711 RepID=A0A4Q7KXA9_9PSEU|nr:Ig-like domain-containing protein [Herbihabitans rhizosphaerae]RZS40940.1 lipoprotein-anchoring transpeptidase ErfK/SrfK [Herbihabitans rhizosphaerae]
MGRKFTITAAAVGAAVLAGLTGCTTSVTGGAHTEAETSTPAVTAEPAAGAQDTSPAQPVRVTAAGAELAEVALTNAEGRTVAGTLSADRRVWTAGEPLGYGKRYTWFGRAVTRTGDTLPIGGEFSTVRPARQVRAKVNTGDGQTYGVAMPISVTFDAPVKDKTAVERAMPVRTSVPTEGSWAWLDDRTAHWRPRQYWTPGTEVAVDAKLYGVAFGGGSYGLADVSSKFTIGRSQVVKADTRTHRMKVVRDGVQIADYPASYGLESDPGRVTPSGTHVVMSKEKVVSMTNPKYGYYNVSMPWAMRVSNNGVYIHGNPESIAAQGNRNVSHGCVNLSPVNAKAYFETALVGDPVEIEGSTVRLSAKDGDFYDWTLSWEQWRAKSALRAEGP